MTDDLVEQLLTAHRLPPVESQLLCDKAAARIGQQASRIALLEKAFEEHGGRYWEARYRDEAAEVERLQAKLAEMNDSDIIARTMTENERLRDALKIAIVLVAAELPYAPMLPHLRAALENKQ